MNIIGTNKTNGKSTKKRGKIEIKGFLSNNSTNLLLESSYFPVTYPPVCVLLLSSVYTVIVMVTFHSVAAIMTNV